MGWATPRSHSGATVASSLSAARSVSVTSAKQVQITHRPQHVGAVGTLAAPGPDQATRLEMPEHLFQQQVLGMTGQQT
jgi:hypothetical protein